MNQTRGYDKITALFRGRPGPLQASVGAGQEPAEVAHVGGRSRDETQARGVTVEDTMALPVMPIPDAGYVAPMIPAGFPGLVSERNNFEQFLPPKSDRYPRPGFLYEKKTIVVGGGGGSIVLPAPYVIDAEVGFGIRTMRVDNFTNQFILIRGPEQYIPPLTFGVILPMLSQTQKVQAIWEAPGNIAQPVQVVGQVVHFWAYEDDMDPSPGFQVNIAL